MTYLNPTLTPRIPLQQACKRIADFLGLNGSELLAYALEDEIGGYHHDQTLRTFDHGIWGVEGQVLYALVRALSPLHILEVGNCWGNSTSHLADAVLRNGVGKITTLDLEQPVYEGIPPYQVPDRYAPVVTVVYKDLREFNYRTKPRLDFVFEDAWHTEELTGHVWREFAQWAKPGAVIVSHDSEHFSVGVNVQRGIEQMVPKGEYLSLAIDPADCGLAIWRKVDA